MYPDAAHRPLPRSENPEDLLGDEHLREEFGINKFTTPSIRKLFDDLDKLGSLPYERLKRKIPKSTPRDRARAALALGVLIADGFLVVQSEKVEDLEQVGRAVLSHADALGAGKRVTKHTKAILENSSLGDFKELKAELAKTQADVEIEMVLLRDVDIAHMVALGGWLRAFQIGSVTTDLSYTKKRAELLARTDIVDYFLGELATLQERAEGNTLIPRIHKELAKIRALIELPKGANLEKSKVTQIRTHADKLVKMITRDAAS